jgi:hypothetical protein
MLDPGWGDKLLARLAALPFDLLSLDALASSLRSKRVGTLDLHGASRLDPADQRLLELELGHKTGMQVWVVYISEGRATLAAMAHPAGKP